MSTAHAGIDRLCPTLERMAQRGFAESDEEQIYFECWGDAAEVVILGHGLGGSHAVWYQQVAFLAQRYRVVTWDQRGFGRSTRSTGEIGPAPAVGDMVRVLDAAGVGSAHVVGQSMGGWSALGFAIEHPDRVRSLILADSTAGIFTPEIRHALVDYGAAISLAQTPGEMPLGFHPAIGTQLADEDLAHAFLYGQLGSLTEPPSPAEIMPLLLAMDLTDEATTITCPTLFVVGEHDPIFPPQLIESAASVVEGATVESVANTGHSPYFERPDQWNSIVEEFLRQSGQ
jgi:pimeloyl-ACP methyl ester carboxylesterase